MYDECMSGQKCPEGCECGRHKRSKESFRSGSTKCPPDCECGRHKPKSEAHRQAIIKANQARAGESHACPEGCECGRHQVHYRGGSKKGRVLSEQAIQNIRDGIANTRVLTDEGRQSLSDHMKARREDPEFLAKMLAAWQESVTPCIPGCECGRHSEETRKAISQAHLGRTHSEETREKISAGLRAAWALVSPEDRSEIAWQRIKRYGVAKVSKPEYALAPYLAALGYRHNDDRALTLGRKFPDFYDEENRRLFEYFGHYYHPNHEEEISVYHLYRSLGWDCIVLWEKDVFKWVMDHKHLLTEEQFEATWEIIKRSAPKYYREHRDSLQGKE